MPSSASKVTDVVFSELSDLSNLVGRLEQEAICGIEQFSVCHDDHPEK